MCTNFVPTQNTVWVKENFDLDLPFPFPLEAYPGYLAPIVVRHTKTDVTCGLAKFGLIPHWAKDETFGRHTYNARAETVSEKPSYRTPWKKQQYCLVLADSFFEPNYESGKAVRWEIKRSDMEPMAIASIYDSWLDKESGEWVTSFSMLTINADIHPIMNKFHRGRDEKRTPVVLKPEYFQKWLSATPSSAKEMMELNLLPELVALPHPKR